MFYIHFALDKENSRRNKELIKGALSSAGNDQLQDQMFRDTKKNKRGETT
jgi:hypothetical protein